MPKDSAWLEEMTTTALQSPLICLNPQDDPTLIPKPSSHLSTGTVQTHFPNPKASLSHETQPTRATNRRHKSLLPFPTGPLTPHSYPPQTPLQTQSKAPLRPWALARWCHLLKSPRANWAFPRGLHQRRFQKGSPLSQSSQWRFQARDLESIRGLWGKLIRSSPPAGRAQQPHGHGTGPGPLGPVSTPRLAMCSMCLAMHRSTAHTLSFGLSNPGKGSSVTCLAHGGPETCRVTRKWQVEVWMWLFLLPFQQEGPPN